jgi:hypothetical protein
MLNAVNVLAGFLPPVNAEERQRHDDGPLPSFEGVVYQLLRFWGSAQSAAALSSVRGGSWRLSDKPPLSRPFGKERLRSGGRCADGSTSEGVSSPNGPCHPLPHSRVGGDLLAASCEVAGMVPPLRIGESITVVLLTPRVRPGRHIRTRSVRSTFQIRHLLIRRSLQQLESVICGPLCPCQLLG